MRKLLFVLIAILFALTAASPGFARDRELTFEWEQEVPADLAGWNLYVKAGSSGGGYLANYQLLTTIVYTGNILATYTSDVLMQSPDNETHEYFFVLTAFDLDGNESGASNEVSAIIDFIPPGAPTTFTVKIK